MKTLTTTQQTELDSILSSEDFNNIFDFEQEKEELAQAGWTHQEVKEFANSLTK